MFRRSIVFVFLAVLVYGTQAQSHLDSILYDFHNQPGRILVAAHRAPHVVHPENSIPAMKEAIVMGVDIIESDVRETKDGVLVMIHDKTVDRTTNGKGQVSEMTFAELQKLNLVHNGQVTQEKIPTFKEVLALVKGKIMLDIDYKADGVRAAKSTTKLLRKMKMEKQCLFFLYDYKDAASLLKLNKRLQFLVRTYNQADVEAVLSSNIPTPAIHADNKFYTDSLMNVIRSSGKRLWMNSLGRYDEKEKQQPGKGFDELLQLGHTNIIQTDLPRELLLYLKQKNLHR